MTNDIHETCPTPNSHQRLEHAHSYWHETLQHYADPSEFRRHLNSCLQEMRNFSFLLQNEISGNSDAKISYASWQGRQKDNSLMTWLNQSRVQVVHQKDLTLKSTAHVRIVATYADAGHEVARAITGGIPSTRSDDGNEDMQFFLNPETSTDQILQALNSRKLPMSILEQSTVSIERTWIVDSLPDMELLAALSFCFGEYLEMMHGIHGAYSVDFDACDITSSVTHPLKSLVHDGSGDRPSCMITSRTSRTLSIRLRDGVTLGGEILVPIQLSEELDAETRERYGSTEPEESIEADDPFSMIPFCIKRAKQIVLAGDQHDWIVFLFKGKEMDILNLLAEDQADKRALMQGIAEMCAKEGVDGILMIGETWMAPISMLPDGAPTPAAKHPQRTDGLMFHAETKDGKCETVYIPIIRRLNEEPTFGEERRDLKGLNWIEPVRAVWRTQANS